MFDSDRSTRYDGVVTRLIEGYGAMLGAAAWSLRAWLPGPAKILVVGCGTGNDIIRLATIAENWTFVGVDSSPYMVDRASSKMLEHGLRDRVELRIGSAEVASDQKFDGALCLLVTHFYPSDESRKAILQSIANRLVATAPLFISELCVGRETPVPWFAEAWKVGAIERGIKPADLDRLLQGVGTEVFLRRAAQTERLIRQSGFVRVNQVFQSHALFGWLAEKSRHNSF